MIFSSVSHVLFLPRSPKDFSSNPVIFLKFIFILFIYFWLHWVFVAAHGLSLFAVCRGYSSWRCVGFSLWWLLVGEHGL